MKSHPILNYLLFFSLLLGSFASFSQENKFGTYYNQRLTLFEKLPDTKGEIIFLGNSITDGINDLSRGVSRDSAYSNICRIAQKIRKDSPKTRVYVQRILPVNDSFGLFKNPDSELLNPQLTNDGLHPKGEAYLFWAETIKSYLTRKY